MNNFCGPIENGLCPVTGLTIFNKPEWIDVTFGKDYRASFYLLGESILFLQSSGYVTYHDIKNFITVCEKVKREAVPEGCTYIRIEEWTNLRGTSRRAREAYIHYLKDYEQPELLILFGLSTMFMAGVKLGRRIYKLDFDVKIASDYSEAVTLAQDTLLRSQNRSENYPKVTKSSFHHNSDVASTPRKIISQPDWVYQSDGFSMRCEILYERVLHIMSTGKFKEEDVEPIFTVLANVAKSMSFSNHHCYAVLSLQESKGTKQKARISYYKAIKKIYQKFPFKMTILYGVNRFLKAAINFNRHFLPIKVRITDDLNDALGLAIGHKSKNVNLELEHTKTDREVTSYHPDRLERYENELLQFIEKINWEKDDIDQNTNIDPAHPFSRVFDAIALVKWELDDLISERTKTGKELRQAKEKAESANLAKSEFLANMSHELRTPLNHIIGFTELVIDKTVGDLNKVQEEYLTDVHNSSKHLLSLINDILDLSKVEAGKLDLTPSTVALKMLLENSLIMVQEKASKNRINLSCDIHGIPESIEADERKLKQIQYNLLSNAVKFTPTGGDVTLKARVVDLGNDSDFGHLKTKSNHQKWIHISVTDTGIGLTKENMDRIFNPFEQVEHSKSRKYQGTGLGLSLTKTFVELHGGKIWVKSEGIGKGCKFNYILPSKG